MSNRSLLVGAPTVEVDMDRYDELLRKEEKLDILHRMVINKNPIDVEAYLVVLGEVEHE